MQALRRILYGTLAWLLILASPAAAKMPPYEATVEVDGDQATVTVVFLDYDMGVQELEGVLGLYPAEVVTDGPPSPGTEFTPILLSRVAEFTYEGSVTVPQAGGWAIVPFPGSTGVPVEMYPTLAFTVSDSGLQEVAGAADTIGESTISSPATVAPDVESNALGGETERGITVLPFSGDPSQGSSSNLGLLTGVVGLGVLVLASAWAVKRRRHVVVP